MVVGILSSSTWILSSSNKSQKDSENRLNTSLDATVFRVDKKFSEVGGRVMGIESNFGVLCGPIHRTRG